MFEDVIVRIKAAVRALMPADWIGSAGERFRKTGSVIADFSREHIRPEEKLEELPDLAWNRVKGEANEKHSRALLNFADEESKKIANELASRTSDDKAREVKASADKMESDARISQTNEMMARIALIERCRQLGILPVWNKSGSMTFLKAPPKLDWDSLSQKLLTTEDLQNIYQLEDANTANQAPPVQELHRPPSDSGSS